MKSLNPLQRLISSTQRLVCSFERSPEDDTSILNMRVRSLIVQDKNTAFWPDILHKRADLKPGQLLDPGPRAVVDQGKYRFIR